MNECRFIQVIHKVARHTDESWELLCGRCVERNVMQVRHVQTLLPGISTVQAFHQGKDALVPQHHLSHPDVLEKLLDVDSCQEGRAHHVFQDVCNTFCSRALPVLLLKRDGKVQGRRHEIHKRGVMEHN